MNNSCPAILIAAPASGHGKTTVTAAMARYYRNCGLKVRCFKSGPDFIDPMILEQASGNPVYQLDNWMVGEKESQKLLFEAAKEADLILVEGVMGLFDGTPSSADLAERFNLPVVPVIDAKAMAQTFGAIAHGLVTYRPSLTVAGVIANRIGSTAHLDMLSEGVADNIPVIAALFRDDEVALPSRHLGLVQAEEIADLDIRLEQAAAMIGKSLKDWLPPLVDFIAPKLTIIKPSLQGVTIGVARDSAFSFIYRANLDLLKQLGAELCFFSPLEDKTLPTVDALYLPGGYPELYLDQLAQNSQLIEAIRSHVMKNKVIIAECGGMLYLLESLTDKSGKQAKLCGILPGNGFMQTKLVGLGLHTAHLPEGALRGHAFHHSKIDMRIAPLGETENRRTNGRGEVIYRHRGISASYLHYYFPSNIAATVKLFQNHL
ncbi:MAG: cobyrinate a,c-diamide synthase [Chromatiales bacterium]|nr:cobyrinate a,c-diamide synthase [Chromatiales bacterium]